MTNHQDYLTSIMMPDDKRKSFERGNSIKKYFYHWPLFIVFLLIFMPLAIYYASTLSPIYEVKASLIIKNDKKNLSTQSSALHEIDLINSAKTIENEIEILRSKRLISRVIDDLKLKFDYQLRNGQRKTDLYKSSPVIFDLLKPGKDKSDNKILITIVDQNHFDYITGNGAPRRLLFDKTYNSNVGSWKLKPQKDILKYKGKTIDINIYDQEKLSLQYQNLIDVNLSNKLSSIVVLTLSDSNAQRGTDILNSLIVNYNLETSNDKNKDLKNTISFLDQKIESLSGDLGSSEKDIEGFKSSRGLTDIAMQTKVSLENLQMNDIKLNDANIQLDLINRIDKYVNTAENSEKAPSANGITDIGLTNLIEKLSKLQLQYEELSATTPETSPDFDPIKRQMVSTRAAIKESVRNIKFSLQSTRDKLKLYNSRFETSIKSIPTQERQYVDIKRQQSSKESLYTYYLQKREEAAANYAAILTDDKVIDPAYADLPKSKKSMAYLAGIFLSFGFPIGIIFARNAFSDSIHSQNDIKDLLGDNIPIVAEVPFDSKKSQIAVNNKNSSPTSEQFRSLRTRLHYLHDKKANGRVTLVTSSIPSEGKTFISTNLSISLALTERRTILLELDMRKPMIREALKLQDNKLGLSDYFMGNAEISEIIQDSPTDPNLKVISSGSSVPNPSELLERKRLATLITYLKDHYDDIIIDSPPTHLVPDATIVSPLTDVCLYVMRQGHTNKKEVVFLNELILQRQLINVSIVFNGVENKRHGYGYTYDNSYYSPSGKYQRYNMFSDFSKRF